jgi:hypothetical protein
MPPSDPRERPALEEALPSAGIRDGTWRAVGEPAEVLFGDPHHPGGPHDWRLVTVVARWQDRRGRPVVQLEWSAALTMWGGTYVASPERIREA